MSEPVCFACSLAGRNVRLYAVQIMRSVNEGGVTRSRSLPARLCRKCILEIARRVHRPPLPMRARRPWSHRTPPRVKVCEECGSEFRAWHERARWCSQPCRSRGYEARRRLREGTAA